MKQRYNEILQKVSNGESAFEKRKWLAENVKGIGYKEATHFLRNVGLEQPAWRSSIVIFLKI